MIKTLSKLGREGNFLTMTEKKKIYKKTYTNIILNGEKQEASLLR